MDLKKTPLLLLVLIFACVDTASAGDSIDFNQQIRPILFGSCINCHGPDDESREAGLRLDTEGGSQVDLGGYAAVVPGDPDASELLSRIMSDDEELRMPPEGKGKQLTEEDVAVVRQWIQQGGKYASHWSYQKPIRPELPPIKNSDRAMNPIDHFVLSRLEADGKSPSLQADRLTLARRVAIDLTGLPPTWQQAQQFVEDSRSDAYERYVDRLIAMPAFGERWARVWLDLARYADSAGYADDRERTIWAYRDYVIRSLNENKPFDQFTIEQIAGDLLENPTDEQLIATAFHRNTMTNSEGGTIDEEFRSAAIVDRVNTTMSVWMGTTMGCAQCHTHKYDPITIDEYFQFYAFFNNTADADRPDESPLLEVWSDHQKSQKTNLQSRINELTKTLDSPTQAIREDFSTWSTAARHAPDWNPLAPEKASATHRQLTIMPDGWVHAEGERPQNDSYSVSFPTTADSIAALRIEVAPQESNFVLTAAIADWVPEVAQPVTGRYVRVELPGNSRILHLAEIEVVSGGKNVATQGTATQSSTDYGGEPRFVNDGNSDGNYTANSVSHTSTQDDPWIEVDLGTAQPIQRIAVWNRTDGGTPISDRLKGFQIKVLDDQRHCVYETVPDDVPAPKIEWVVDGSQRLNLVAAHADYQQPDFSAIATIQSPSDLSTGWAVGGQSNQAHELALILQEPLQLGKGTLTLTLNQASVHQDHTIEQFRVSYSVDQSISKWAELPGKIRGLLRMDPAALDATHLRELQRYHQQTTPLLDPLRQELVSVKSELDLMKPETTVPINRELSEKDRRTTHVQLRGSYLSQANEVDEGTPEAFHPLRADERPDRLDLAHWLIDDENPLTPRVIANRYWEQLFGRGIVETSEEYGSQGEMPSHPELLDWLACELRDSGWDTKALIKLMVTSATYRQSSRVTPEMIEEDPQNQWLARGPRFRISAEMVRDQALRVSGLLSDKMYGPPVKPPQPNLGLRAAFGGATDWTTSEGADKHRRAIYTLWRRSSPYPSMSQFDAPNSEVCTVRRIRTNTPLQALVTLNDPVYMEAAQSLARQTIATELTNEARIRHLFETCLIRKPTAQEIQRLAALAGDATEVYRKDLTAAEQIATDPMGDLPADADVAEYAAWTVVGNVVLNLDEIFMKR